MIWDIFAGFYVGMAVFFSVSAYRPRNASIAFDTGAALVASIWIVPYTMGLIKRAFWR